MTAQVYDSACQIRNTFWLLSWLQALLQGVRVVEQWGRLLARHQTTRFTSTPHGQAAVPSLTSPCALLPQVEWVAPSLDLLLIECLLENLKVLYDPKTQRCAHSILFMLP